MEKRSVLLGTKHNIIKRLLINKAKQQFHSKNLLTYAFLFYIIVTYSHLFCPQPEPDLAAILERLKSLEQKQQPTVDSIKRDIVQYALRQSTDFDKHLVIEKIEYLKHVARDLEDKKADYYSSVYSILLERINENEDQFKTYVLALLGDRDYERIIEVVNKVGKTFNKTTNPSTHNPALAPRIPTPVPAVPGIPQMQSFSFPSVPSPYFRPNSVLLVFFLHQSKILQ